jgi:hypothetical protein
MVVSRMEELPSAAAAWPPPGASDISLVFADFSGFVAYDLSGSDTILKKFKVFVLNLLYVLHGTRQCYL